MHYLCVRKWAETKDTCPYCRQDIYNAISEGDIVVTAELIDMAYEMYSIEASIQSQTNVLQMLNNTVLESKRAEQPINRRNSIGIRMDSKRGTFSTNEARLMNLLDAYESYENDINQAKHRLNVKINKLNAA